MKMNLKNILMLCNHCETIKEQYVIAKKKEKLLEFKECIDLLFKLLNNIKTNPNEEKYRRLRSDNKTFLKKVSVIDGYQLLLQYIGFQFISSIDNGIYIYDSNISLTYIESLCDFLNQYSQYLQHSYYNNITNNENNNNNNTKKTIMKMFQLSNISQKLKIISLKKKKKKINKKKN